MENLFLHVYKIQLIRTNREVDYREQKGEGRKIIIVRRMKLMEKMMGEVESRKVG